MRAGRDRGDLNVEDVEQFRTRARTWITANLEPRNAANPHVFDFDAERALQARMFDAGFTGFMFPLEYGGLGLAIDHQRAFFEEAAGYFTPSYFAVSIGMLGATILDCGTEEQKRRHLPAILRADEIFVQLLSEPSGGSDLAGALTRDDARRRHLGDQRLQDLDLRRRRGDPRSHARPHRLARTEAQRLVDAHRAPR